MIRLSESRKPLSRWLPIVCSVAFLGAINYCTLEALAAHPAQSHDSHPSASTKHHDDESSTPAHHHDQDSVSCCLAMQAVVTSKIPFHPTSNLAGQLHPWVLQSAWPGSRLENTCTANGLSPPTREPTPARPFYRTTFASHAPPVYLA